ncbi:MAG: pantoate--beta-alanine ligase [Rhodocyclaceae bacterium]|nr:pantoate--beta-alanine ligase [Rhodocyclaceae bacterium]
MSITVFRTPAEWRMIKPATGSIGVIPTMGALHAGHIALVERALGDNKYAVTTIYVNPTQFNNPDDLAAYPQTLDEDCAILEQAGCQFVFAPNYETLYPDQYRYRIRETEISRVLEGEYRPGHFDGMLTVVLRLLNVVGAEVAYFGEKDFQQLLLVREMLHAFQHSTRIVACATVREPDGLAMSSRNRRLNTAQRALAAQWSQTLANLALPCQDVRSQLEALGFRVDYIEERWGRRLGAVYTPQVAGGAEIRLIDNVVLPGQPTF